MLLILGIAMLLAGGTALIRGASALAEMYGVSPLVVGLTVVAFGTSAPELVVNILGALRGETELAFGNIAGSNIANLGLVLGSAAIIAPVAIQGQIIRRELPLLMLFTAVLVVMVMDPPLRGTHALLDRSEGTVLLLLFTIFLYITVRDLLQEKEDPLVTAIGDIPQMPQHSKSFHLVMCLIGGIGLAAGAHFTIEHGSALAYNLGISPAVVGMVVVAIGTSLPELVTSIIAAYRKQADLCVGNVIGSNLFNTVFVLPISALVAPINVPSGGAVDLGMGLLLAAAMVPVFVFGNAIMQRWAGALFLLAYAGYMTARLMLA